jgi:beta-glucanase (GH16 family)
MSRRSVVALASLMVFLSGGLRAGVPRLRQGDVVYFDDFDEPDLNRSRWNVLVTGRTVNNEQQAYVDSGDTIYLARGEDAEGAVNGALVIKPRFSPGFETPEGRSFDFVSGRLESRGKVEFSYGTVSARIKMTAGDGLWPAFWTLGPGRWPDTGEMDIMENVGDPLWTNAALHGPGYSGNTPFVKRRAFARDHDITEWHVYSMDWKADGFVFKVDDDAFYTPRRTEIETRGRWAYDDPKFLILNFAIGGQYPQAVNHAAEPYAGVPQATVDLIKAGKVKMMVDWVKVTKN